MLVGVVELVEAQSVDVDVEIVVHVLAHSAEEHNAVREERRTEVENHPIAFDLVKMYQWCLAIVINS